MHAVLRDCYFAATVIRALRATASFDPALHLHDEALSSSLHTSNVMRNTPLPHKNISESHFEQAFACAFHVVPVRERHGVAVPDAPCEPCIRL
jgi:hypothetical protein